MDDDLRKPIRLIKKEPENNISPLKDSQIQRNLPKKVRTSRSLKLILVTLLIVIISVAGFLWHRAYIDSGLPNPLPSNTAKNLSFNLYYPNPSLLPPGYTLNMNSFNASSLAVVYSVSYGNNKIIFSVQQEPSKTILQTFYTTRMPIYISKKTNIGNAAIGVVNNQTLVSLPTNTNAWLLITTPSNINQTKLTVVLNAIEIARR